MQNKIINLLLKRRVICLGLVILLTIAAFSQLAKLKVDNSNERFFLKGDVVQLRMDEFKQTFGNDDFVFILLETEEVFNADTLLRIESMVNRLEMEVPHLSGITWIGNVESIKGVHDGILIDGLIPRQALEGVNAGEALKRIAVEAIADPSYRNKLISADRKTTGIFLEFDNYPEMGDPRKEIPPAIKKITEEFTDLTIHITGWPIIDHHIDQKSSEEGPVWLSAALLGITLLLLLITRSIVGVLVPLVTVILSIIWTMAIIAMLGFTLNLLAIMVPTLLLCVGIGDTMHVMVELMQQMRSNDTADKAFSRINVLQMTLVKVNQPVFLTTLTTSMGFLAFLATDLVPLRELGIQAAIGVWMAFLLTYLFAVPLLSFGKIKTKSGQQKTTDIFDKLLQLIMQVVINFPRVVGIVFVGITSLFFYGMSQLHIESNGVKDLPPEDPVRLAFEFVDTQMGGSMGMELLVKTGQADGIKNRTLMQSIEQLQQFLDQHPLIVETSSIVEQLKQMHRAVHENKPEYYRLPETDSQIAEYLLLYETGGGEQLDQFVSFTYDVARIQIRTRSLGIMQVEDLENDISHYLSQHWQQGEVVSTGTLVMFRALGHYIATGQAKSFLFAFAVITLIMIIVLRSISLGLIAMVPNVFPIIVALGAMGLAGADLNMTMLILAPIILGVAVDDSIHFFVRYCYYFNQSGLHEQAYQQTMNTVGRPILLTTCILIVGFCGFFFSDFGGPKIFAWVSGLAFFSALLADFMLVPLLLRWCKPLHNERYPDTFSFRRFSFGTKDS